MSIQQQQEINDLKARVAWLEEQVARLLYAKDQSTPPVVAVLHSRGTLTLPEKARG